MTHTVRSVLVCNLQVIELWLLYVNDMCPPLWRDQWTGLVIHITQISPLSSSTYVCACIWACAFVCVCARVFVCPCVCACVQTIRSDDLIVSSLPFSSFSLTLLAISTISLFPPSPLSLYFHHALPPAVSLSLSIFPSPSPSQSLCPSVSHPQFFSKHFGI